MDELLGMATVETTPVFAPNFRPPFLCRQIPCWCRFDREIGSDLSRWMLEVHEDGQIPRLTEFGAGVDRVTWRTSPRKRKR